MKHLIAMIAVALFAAVPVLAQDEGEIIELPSGEKVRIVEKDGVRIIKPVEKNAETTEEAESRKTESTRKTEKDIEEVELEDDFETDLRKQVKKALEKAREDMDRAEDWPEFPEHKVFPEDIEKRMEEMRKRMEELRKRLEKTREEWEDEDGNNVEREVEEYESPDGSVKIKIVRIRKTSKSTDKAETPEPPKKTEQPRKQ